jgi:PIN domain nuclease of toxin-antitoxin system
VRLLLDTHLLLSVMADHAALSSHARAEIAAAEMVYASAASLWEISIKAALGKLTVDQADLTDKLAQAGLHPLPVTWDHAAAVRRLPDIHRDPFDRMLVAQAVSEPLRLLTHDRILTGYSELVVAV